jgi:hypothetical protein
MGWRDDMIWVGRGSDFPRQTHLGALPKGFKAVQILPVDPAVGVDGTCVGGGPEMASIQAALHGRFYLTDAFIEAVANVIHTARDRKGACGGIGCVVDLPAALREGETADTHYTGLKARQLVATSIVVLVP